jgi:hypothetical protein
MVDEEKSYRCLQQRFWSSRCELYTIQHRYKYNDGLQKSSKIELRR